MIPADVTLPTSVYSILLRAYPAARPRRRFATGMTYAFCRELHAARLRGLPHASEKLWVTTIVSTVWFGISGAARARITTLLATSGETMRCFPRPIGGTHCDRFAPPRSSRPSRCFARARHRRQHGDLLAPQRPDAASAAGARAQQLVLLDRGSWTNPIWEQIRDERELFDGAFAWSRQRFDLARAARPTSSTASRSSGAHLRRPRRAGGARPHAHAGRRRARRRPGRPGRGDQLRLLAAALRRRRRRRSAARSRSNACRSRSSASRRRASSGPRSAASFDVRCRSAPSR